jgi:hypothetical protein
MYPASFAESSEGILYAADGINPVRRWDGYTAGFEDAGLPGPQLAVAGSASGTGTISGTLYLFYSWVDRLGIESSLSPVSAPVLAATNDTITYGSLTEAAPPQAVSRRLYRTLDGAARVAYLDAETTDLSSTSVASTHTDDDIRANLARPLLDDANRDITLNHRQPPDHKPFLVWHLQTMYFLGSARYSGGSVKVTAASTTVRGTGTAWPATFAGRFLYVDGADAPYEIASVDAAAQTLTLTAAYGGPSDPFAGYTIEPPPGEGDLAYFSLPGQPEYVPAVNAFALPEDNDVTTGGLSLSSFLYVLKRTRVYRFTVQSNPAKDGFLFPAADRGCVNNRCAVAVGGEAYLLDERGVYRFDGSDAVPVSGPVQDFFRPGAETPIHWPAAASFHAVNDPGRDTVRFFVCLRGDHQPRHALAYCHGLNRWAVEEYPFPVTASTLGWAGRQTASARQLGERVYLGTKAGRALILGGAAGDGVPGGAATAYRVLSAGPASAVVSPGTVPADLVNGFAVAVARGRGRGQVRRVVAWTATTLTVDRPWLVRPDATSVLVLGGIPYRYRTHAHELAPAEAAGERSVRVEFRPRPGETADLKLRADAGDWVRAAADIDPAENAGVRAVRGQAELEVDLGKVPSAAWTRFDGNRETYTDGALVVQFELSGVSGERPHGFSRLVLKGCR